MFVCLFLSPQVGSYFVSQYYNVLRQQPDYVHQFYSDASTMIRVDGDSKESASAMMVFLLARCRVYVLRFFLVDFLSGVWKYGNKDRGDVPGWLFVWEFLTIMR